MWALNPTFWLQTSSVTGLGAAVISPCLCHLHCVSHHWKPCFLEATLPAAVIWSRRDRGAQERISVRAASAPTSNHNPRIYLLWTSQSLPTVPSLSTPVIVSSERTQGWLWAILIFLFLECFVLDKNCESICRPKGRICCFRWYHDTLSWRPYFRSALTFVYHKREPKFWRSLSNCTQYPIDS